MLFKLAFRNMRRSARDFAVYFFTLILGVAVFYVFNAIGAQTAYLKLAADMRNVVEVMRQVISTLSVFIAFVLGFLVVYANRFLMKRRNGEFALYLLLGMGKGSVAVILLLETALVGVISLILGLAAGVGLSQVMSVVVARMFEADMTGYIFVFSAGAFLRTVLCFLLILAVSVVFNLTLVGKCRLIDLMTSGRRAERIRMKNPVLGAAVFAAGAVMLGLAYYQVTAGAQFLRSPEAIVRPIAMGAAATFLLFRAISDLLLCLFSAMKRSYFSGINSFTFRQISSRVGTTSVSMAVICLMLFVTICVMGSALSIRDTMNGSLRQYAPVDAVISRVVADGGTGERLADLEELYAENGGDVAAYFRESEKLYTYRDPALTIGSTFGALRDRAAEHLPGGMFDTQQNIVGISDYNRFARLYGNPEYELRDDEYLILCDFANWKEARDLALAAGTTITVFGNVLSPVYGECRSGFLQIGASPSNAGIVVVPDETLEGGAIYREYIAGNYRAENPEQAEAMEERVLADANVIWEKYGGIPVELNTKLDVRAASVGTGALVTFVALYIGFVFVISGAAVLALKALSESLDSAQSYRILRQLGAEERDISRSVFRQVGVFFLLPLLLAVLHSVFGMQFAMYVLKSLGIRDLLPSIAMTAVLFLVVYGGYFAITFASCRAITRKED